MLIQQLNISEIKNERIGHFMSHLLI